MSAGVAIRAEVGHAKGWLRVLRWLARRIRAGRLRPERQLRLSETLPLGEKRFLAVVEFEQRRLLIGGTSNSLVVLAALPGQGHGGTSEECGEARNSWRV